MPINKLKVLHLARNFRNRARNCIVIARRRVERALQHAYVGRKQKKRDWRAVWIQRINAGAREHGVSYARLIHGLAQENIQLNRKVLSELAMHEPLSFKALADQVRFMRGGPGRGAPLPPGTTPAPEAAQAQA